MYTRFLSMVAMFVCFASACMPALSQWAWRDANNQLVFSDRPPPMGIKPSQIVQQPGSGSNTPGDLLAPPAAASRPSATPAVGKTLAEREMEFRKRQLERDAADKKGAEAEARAAQQAQECQRARGYLRTLEDGVNVIRDDGQGNRKYLDDAQRREEVQRTKDAVARACSGG